MTKLESLKEQIEDLRNWACADSASGSRDSRQKYQVQIMTFDLVLGMIRRMDTSICLRCGGTVEANHGQSKCLNCGAAHDIEGNLVPTINGKYIKPSNARASKG